MGFENYEIYHELEKNQDGVFDDFKGLVCRVVGIPFEEVHLHFERGDVLDSTKAVLDYINEHFSGDAANVGEVCVRFKEYEKQEFHRLGNWFLMQDKTSNDVRTEFPEDFDSYVVPQAVRA